MVLVIDNYDSFTYNLVQYLGEMQVELQVHRNDRITIEQIRALAPERILISPGPCSPREAAHRTAPLRNGPERIIRSRTQRTRGAKRSGDQQR